MHKIHLYIMPKSLLVIGMLALVGCQDANFPSSSTNSNYASLANICELPIQGEKKGTKLSEKKWVYAFMDNTYLWRDKMPRNVVQNNNQETTSMYFEKLLNPTVLADGRWEDNFSGAMLQSDFEYFNGLIYTDFGFKAAELDQTTGGSTKTRVVLADVEIGSVAEANGLRRGDEILSINDKTPNDGNDFYQLMYYPLATKTYTVKYKKVTNGTEATVQLKPYDYAISPVRRALVLDGVDGVRTGYLLYNGFDNDEDGVYQTQLADTFQNFKNNKIKRLVIDLRYNPGGYVSLAAQLGYMIAGDATKNKVFAYAQYNKNRATEAWGYLDTYLNAQTKKETLLPTLNFKEVTVLTSDGTCSASELLINTLRGIGVEVNVVGSESCGKPYAYVPESNCGVTYIAMQIKYLNAQKQANYIYGFKPNSGCKVIDNDFNELLGSPNELMLNKALQYQAYGSCNTLASSAKASRDLLAQKTAVAPRVISLRTPNMQGVPSLSGH